MRAGRQSDSDELRLASFLPYRLSVLTNRISRALSRQYAEQFNLSIPQWRALAVLGESGDLFADEICKVTEMDKVTVSRALQGLEEQGRISRKTDSSDRRRARVRLTSMGRAVYREVVPAALEYERQLLDVLSTSEQRTLDDALGKLHEWAATDDED